MLWLASLPSRPYLKALHSETVKVNAALKCWIILDRLFFFFVMMMDLSTVLHCEFFVHAVDFTSSQLCLFLCVGFDRLEVRCAASFTTVLLVMSLF